MSTMVTLTDGLLREALSPAVSGISTAELARTVSERTRTRRQVRRRLRLPWLAAPASTLGEARRARVIRVAVLVALMALATGAAIAGARILLRPAAPPQVLMLQGGLGYSVALEGGDRRPIPALAGRNLLDFSIAGDGSLLATLRGPKAVLEIWDATDVLGGEAAAPVAVPDSKDLLVLDAGAWRPDGASLLVTASAHGAHRVYLVDAASGSMTQVSPPNVYVDDWQPSSDGRWIEIAGQVGGNNALFVVDLTNLSYRVVMESVWERVPEGGALGWAPDSSTMTFHLRDGSNDLGIWTIDRDGGNARRLTPAGQPAWWMNWSPDGRWIGYGTSSAQPTCPGGDDRGAVWIVHPDGSDAHLLADGALPVYWTDDSRAMVVDSSIPMPGAPLGGMAYANLDGSPRRLLAAHLPADATGSGCHPFEVLTKLYRGMARGIH